MRALYPGTLGEGRGGGGGGTGGRWGGCPSPQIV